MTAAQKAWLDAHPDYTIVPAGGAYAGPQQMTRANYLKMLALHEDGTAERKKAAGTDIVVGIKPPPPSPPGGRL
jgi:hypothetical protein